MLKVTINGEVFAFDRDHRPLAEAIALEKVLGMRYAQYQQELAGGSARALAAFVWLVWRRDGRDIQFADIESGNVPVAEEDVLIEDTDGEAEPNPADPTVAAPAGTPGTGTATSASSPSGSASARGKSGSSTSTTSKP